MCFTSPIDVDQALETLCLAINNMLKVLQTSGHIKAKWHVG